MTRRPMAHTRELLCRQLQAQRRLRYLKSNHDPVEQAGNSTRGKIMQLFRRHPNVTICVLTEVAPWIVAQLFRAMVRRRHREIQHPSSGNRIA